MNDSALTMAEYAERYREAVAKVEATLAVDEWLGMTLLTEPLGAPSHEPFPSRALVRAQPTGPRKTVRE